MADKRILTFIVVIVMVSSTLAFTPLLGTVQPGGYSRSPSGALLCPFSTGGFSFKDDSERGPSHWAEISPCCGGGRQSPRDLAFFHGNGQCVDQTTRLHYNSSCQIRGHVFNNGRNPIFQITGKAAVYLSGAPNTAALYVLSGIHIHFHTELGGGSEHSIAGRLFDAEVHLVNYKAEYGSIREAILHQDGLVVVALFLEIVCEKRRRNLEIARLIKRLKSLKGIGQEHQIPHHVNLANLLPTSQDYFTYEGSLTTPPCSESVRWIVVKNPLYIHPLELKILASLESAEGGLISDNSNNRPLQTGDTKVQRNFACRSYDTVSG